VAYLANATVIMHAVIYLVSVTSRWLVSVAIIKGCMEELIVSRRKRQGDKPEMDSWKKRK